MHKTDKQTLLHNIFEGLRINMKLSEDLLSALDEEGAAIRAMDTAALFRLSQRKEELLAKIVYIDNSLTEMVADLAGIAGNATAPAAANSSGRPAPLARLGELTGVLSAEQRDFLGSYKKTMRRLRLAIIEKNALNKRFTQDTLDCIGEAIALISRPVPANEKYAVPPGGGRPRDIMQPAFISREV